MNIQADNRRELEEHVAKYANADLICYFAKEPKDLVEKQKEFWNPLLMWIKDTNDINLKTTVGIKHRDQSKESIEKINKLLQTMEFDELNSLYLLTAITGSFVIALALLKEKINIDQAHHAAFVDELYQLDNWGDDNLARKRLECVKMDMFKALGFLTTSSE